ncbi:hypothetical protein HMPREF9374_2385 [Desmospora sp. 8437]|nr:hypothetical protein HMPREF9374_2385 [Desmospora sp. 8437]
MERPQATHNCGLLFLVYVAEGWDSFKNCDKILIVPKTGIHKPSDRVDTGPFAIPFGFRLEEKGDF